MQAPPIEIYAERIAKLDVLKGIVIALMALDHTRDYFHYSSFFIDPTDPEATNGILFFTRWITHFCAPAFSFLAGISAFLLGQRKSKSELSSFLLKRGLWLVIIEVTVVRFGWSFDPYFHSIGLQVIWSLGISMIVLAGMVHFRMALIGWLSVAILAGHNLLDQLPVPTNFWWSLLHEQGLFTFFNGRIIAVAYPIIP